MPKMGSNLWYKQDRKGNKRPIQHSILAQGDIFITSGGSTLMFKHNTKATHPVFICTIKLGVKPKNAP
jgi:alkylated DNA repair dioxygenase AlkB